MTRNPEPLLQPRATARYGTRLRFRGNAMTMTERPVMDRDEILDRLAKVNAQAKAISRRGRAFAVGNETYKDLHCNLDFLCACLAASSPPLQKPGVSQKQTVWR